LPSMIPGILVLLPVKSKFTCTLSVPALMWAFYRIGWSFCCWWPQCQFSWSSQLSLKLAQLWAQHGSRYVVLSIYRLFIN
jgi:hypothetical protein